MFLPCQRLSRLGCRKESIAMNGLTLCILNLPLPHLASPLTCLGLINEIDIRSVMCDWM